MSDAAEDVGEQTDNSPTSEKPQPEISSAKASPTVHPKSTIEVSLKATGNAPIMKNRKWTVERNKKVSGIMGFMRKYLKYDSAESLFLYVNQSFAPSLDVEIGVLYDCFGSDGKLVLHYCRTQAWG